MASTKTAKTKTSSTKPQAVPIHPIQTLRDHAVALEGAIGEAIAEPKKSAVHALRSQTRRLEAQLALLSQLSAVPPHSSEAEALTRRLDKLRRLAGRVRDLDVLRKMLKEDPLLPRKAAEELRDELKQARKRKAAKLQRTLGRQLPKLAAALEQLLQSLATAHGLVLPDVRLVSTIAKWTEEQENTSLPPDQLDDDQLHTARKSAKTARYMAEAATGSEAAARAAAIYEKVQDAGGRWHDWLQLAETARQHFGAQHPLSLAAMEHRDSARAEYIELLR